MPIVYKTTNLVNGKEYIGVHKHDNGTDYLGSGKLLYKAIRKYGAHNFKRETLFTFETVKEALQKERELVTKEYAELESNYNLRPGGLGGGVFGRSLSDEHKEKLRVAQAGVKETERSRIKNSIAKSGQNHPNWGKHLDEHVRHKISLSHKGKILSDDHRRKIGNVQRGKSASDESKRKTSASLTGRKQAVLICPHCNQSGGNMMRRWHFEHCKKRIDKA